jgi:hypothetical protein
MRLNYGVKNFAVVNFWRWQNAAIDKTSLFWLLVANCNILEGGGEFFLYLDLFTFVPLSFFKKLAHMRVRCDKIGDIRKNKNRVCTKKCKQKAFKSGVHI